MKITTCFSLLLLGALPAMAQNTPQSAQSPSQPQSVTKSDGIIYNPQGTLYNGLYRQSVGFFFGTPRNADGLAGAYVADNDGVTYYIQNIFSQFQTDTWVKATLQGDTLYMPTPQLVYSYDDGGETNNIYLSNMKYDEAQQTYVIDSANTFAKFASVVIR